MHKVICLNFTSLVPDRWNSLPDVEGLKRQLASAAIAHSEVHGVELGLYAPPEQVREVKISAAAADQIQCMWHGHRSKGQISPPVIPLKIFVFGMGQDAQGTWVAIEVHPGVDDWEAD
ncbi:MULTISPECIES: hypothetical protein [Paraburkholderia]|uniref:Uncharacterized protein n=1 Tax=Paraburkholderia madseniana TaxID=2599607 RepID=A0AAP5BP40_9BURK|nr:MULTISPECIES: hypothetical protein [Paraburkholderia]MCX4151742.1 hypothetical protein [Paraburkholderia madseniana]MDN7154669.1 hypothetical protein [Paraburkholderia sp. WS6]MDQ6413552.1 hypothetical protein [Paraburkholderia madseniana]